MSNTIKQHDQLIEALLNEGNKRDDIIIAMVCDHKMSIDKATKLYAAYAKDHGLTKVIVSHKDAALEMLATEYPEDNWDASAVKHAIVDLVDQFGVAESTARDYCKAYSTDVLGVKLPTEDPRAAIFQWFVDHDGTAVKDDFIQFALELGRSRSNANEYWKGYELHLHLAQASK